MFSRYTLCMRCAMSVEDASERAFAAAGAKSPINHDGVCLHHCERGHVSVTVHQSGACALLYERALHHLADESPRDAVLDAYTALEMYLVTVSERVLFEEAPGSNLTEIRQRLASAVRTSERAAAAALATIALRTGRPPPRIDSKMIEVRNAATHAGRFPSMHDARAMVLKVASTINEFEECFRSAPRDVNGSYVDAVLRAVYATAYAEHHAPEVTIGSSAQTLALDFRGFGPAVTAEERLEAYCTGEHPRWLS